MVITLTWFIATLLFAMGIAAMLASVGMTLQRRSISGRFQALSEDDTAPRDWLVTLQNALETAGRRIAGSTVDASIRNLMLQAGFFTPAAPYIFVALRAGITVMAGLAMFTVRRGTEGTIDPWTFLVTAGAMFLAYRLASIFVKARAERRVNRIRRELPYVLDIVMMILGSGISIDQCLRHVAHVAEHTAPQTCATLKKYISDVDSGLPYDAALDRMGQRLGADDARDFVSVIKQSLFQGGDLGPALKRFSDDLVQKHLAECREQVGRKALYLTIIMLGFFMPVLLVVLAGPAVTLVTGTLGSVATTTQNEGGAP